MLFAEGAVAERAFVTRMWAAPLSATEPGHVPLLHAIPVLHVPAKVVHLRPATRAGTDGFVALEVVGVAFAEVAPAVLAAVHGGVGATRKAPSQLARITHHPGHAIHAKR